jgi:hypothetical protein
VLGPPLCRIYGSSALLISQGNSTIPHLLDFSNYRHRSFDFQNQRASGVIRLAEKRPSAMTDEASPIHDHGFLDLALSDLANADQAWYSPVGAQPQPWRRMEGAHQQVHRDHSGQRRCIVRGRAQHTRHAAILDPRKERHDCEGRRGREGQQTVRACFRPFSTLPDFRGD